MCAERPKDAVRSPWTEGAWIMTAGEAERLRWVARVFVDPADDDGSWVDAPFLREDAICEARPGTGVPMGIITATEADR